MAIPNQEILTSMLVDFQTRVKPAASLILPYAKNTLYILMTIDLAYAYINLLIRAEASDVGPPKKLLEHFLKYGVFILLVNSYSTIVNQIIASFQMIGLKAAGGSLTVADFTNPSKISEMGIELTKNLWANAGTHEGWIMNPISAFMLTIAGLAIIIAFYIIALQIFIVTLEFAIVAALGLILVPFGVFGKTSFIFDKIKEGIISFGIKYMVLAFVVSISMSMVQGWSSLDKAVTWQQALYMAFGAMALAYLCHHAPAVASGMSSGGGGSLGGVAMAGAMAGVASQGAGHAVNTTKKGVAGVVGAHRGIHGTLNPKTGMRHGGVTGVDGLVDKVTGMDTKSQTDRAKAAAKVAALAGVAAAGAPSTNVNPSFVNSADSQLANTGSQAVPTAQTNGGIENTDKTQSPVTDSTAIAPDGKPVSGDTKTTSPNFTGDSINNNNATQTGSSAHASVSKPLSISGASSSSSNAIPQQQSFQGPQSTAKSPDTTHKTALDTSSEPNDMDHASDTTGHHGAGSSTPSFNNNTETIDGPNKQEEVQNHTDTPKHTNKQDAPHKTAPVNSTTTIDSKTNQQKIEEFRRTSENRRSGIHDPDKYK